MERKQVGIIVYEEVEVLDFCGPFEVFSVTRLHEEKRREEPSPFRAFLVAETKSPVVTTGGMKVVPDHDLDSCQLLAQTTYPYTSTKQGRKAFLKRGCERVKG